jgi:hypothetical protein
MFDMIAGDLIILPSFRDFGLRLSAPYIFFSLRSLLFPSQSLLRCLVRILSLITTRPMIIPVSRDPCLVFQIGLCAMDCLLNRYGRDSAWMRDWSIPIVRA